MSGLLRRISADEAPTPLARALSANYNGSVKDATYQAPPKRRLSPFQPPPLTPLALSGWRESTTQSSRLLSKPIAEEIRLLIPPRLQLVDHWSLVYSLEQNGTSLASLYGKCEQYRGKRGGFVLAVRDADGGVSRECAPFCTSFPDMQHSSSAHSSQTHHILVRTTMGPANVSYGDASAFPRYRISHRCRRHRARTQRISAA